MDAENIPISSLKSWLVENKWQAVIGLFGLFLLLFGVMEWSKGVGGQENEVLVVESVDEVGENEVGIVYVDVGGAVERPGVYQMEAGSRLGEALEAAGGLSDEADMGWVSRNLNLAEVVVDGAKVYVLPIGITRLEGSDLDISHEYGQNKVSINTASLSELIELKGIGQSRASSIVEHRPYQKLEEIVDKAGVPKSVFEEIKGAISL